MISFRFHVVSITAVFLAIAIGVVVGSTYVDGAIVDGLRNRIDSVEENLDERRAENDRLEGELERTDAYIDASDEFAVTDRLTGVPVLLVATRGVDEGRRGAGRAPGAAGRGASRRASSGSRPRGRLEGEEDRTALADDRGRRRPDDSVEDLWAAAWDAVVDRADRGRRQRGRTRATTTTHARRAEAPVVLSALEAAGFLSVDSLDDDSSASRTWSAPRRAARRSPARARRTRSPRWCPPSSRPPSTAACPPSSPTCTWRRPRRPGAAQLIEEALPEALPRGRSSSSTTPTAPRAGSRRCWASTRWRTAGSRPLRLRRRGRRGAAALDGAMTAAPEGAATSMTRSVAGMGAAAAVSRAFGGLRMVVIAAVLGTTYLGNTFQASNSVSNVLFELLAAGALSAVLVPTFVDLFGPGRATARRRRWRAGVLSHRARRPRRRVRRRAWCSRRSSRACSPPAWATPASPRSSRSWPPSSSASSSRRCCSTRSARSPPRCSTPAARSRSPPSRRSATPSCSWRRSSLFHSMAGADPGPRPRRTASGCASPSAARSASPPSWACRPSACGAPGSACGWACAGPGTTPTCVACSASRAGRRSSTRAPASCSPPRSVVAGGVAGGVVAYQLAMVVFLAPYGIVAQPIHTAVLPRLSADAAAGDRDGLHDDLRWAADAMAVGTLPVAAALVALVAADHAGARLRRGGPGRQPAAARRRAARPGRRRARLRRLPAPHRAPRTPSGDSRTPGHRVARLRGHRRGRPC